MKLPWFLMLAFGLFALPAVSPSEALTLNFAWNPVTQNDDGTPGVPDGYNFYRSLDGGSIFTKLLGTSGNVTTASDSAAPTGNVCYQVTAFNRQGESAASNRLCFQVPPASPVAPTNLRTTQ